MPLQSRQGFFFSDCLENADRGCNPAEASDCGDAGGHRGAADGQAVPRAPLQRRERPWADSLERSLLPFRCLLIFLFMFRPAPFRGIRELELGQNILFRRAVANHGGEVVPIPFLDAAARHFANSIAAGRCLLLNLARRVLTARMLPQPVNTREFVSEVLQEIFGHSRSEVLPFLSSQLPPAFGILFTTVPRL